VKQSLTILLAVFFFLSGPASLWADCFKHTHTDHAHHHSTVSDLQHRSDSATADHSAPRVHCSPSQFDLDAIVPTLTTLKPKLLDYKSKLLSRLDLSAQQFSFNIQRRSVETAGKFLAYPFLIGISPHLLLSVFRI
jgi:hypothetical protein